MRKLVKLSHCRHPFHIPLMCLGSGKNFKKFVSKTSLEHANHSTSPIVIPRQSKVLLFINFYLLYSSNLHGLNKSELSRPLLRNCSSKKNRLCSRFHFGIRFVEREKTGVENLIRTDLVSKIWTRFQGSSEAKLAMTLGTRFLIDWSLSLSLSDKMLFFLSVSMCESRQ